MQGHGHHTIGLIHHVIARLFQNTPFVALPKLISPSNPQVRHRHLFDASLVAGRLLIRRWNALGEGGTTEDRGDRVRVINTPLLDLSIGKSKYGLVD